MKFGIIILWYGTLATIPQSWHLCDGNGGTPNLSLKLIIGAGDTYNPGDNDIPSQHYHDFTDDGHMHYLTSPYPNIGSDGGAYRSLASKPATGTTDGYFAVPPYHILGYIMKMC